ncbi:hypothetical protein M3Y98_01090800 [Aphelenchoides besseyi]|nr:hypothetical protein M3Y98_01090800 [Aphelenchoides besseyi]
MDQPEKLTYQVGNTTLEVLKDDFDLAASLGFHSFNYIPLTSVSLSSIKEKSTVNERKAPTEKSVDIDKPSTSRQLIFKAKRVKLITQSCKVCLQPMDQRTFMVEKETFYCSVECINKKVKQITKTLKPRDQLFLTDRRGRLYPNLTNIETLEAFLLRKPNYEPCVRIEEPQDKSTGSDVSSNVRPAVRDNLMKELSKRCGFHDINVTEKRVKELCYEIELDLCAAVKNDVKNLHYRTWFKTFTKFLMISGKNSLEKLLNGKVSISSLTKLSSKLLDAELQKLGELEVTEENTSDIEVLLEVPKAETKQAAPSAPKIKSAMTGFPFKRLLAKPQTKPTTTGVSETKTTEVGHSAIDDILGNSENTTSKHGSHLYDANCNICKENERKKTIALEKLAKNKEERAREKKHTNNTNGLCGSAATRDSERNDEATLEDQMIQQMINDSSKMPNSFCKLRVQLLKLKQSGNAQLLTDAYLVLNPNLSESNKREAAAIVRSKTKLAINELNTSVTSSEQTLDVSCETPPPSSPVKDETENMDLSSDNDDETDLIPPPPPPLDLSTPSYQTCDVNTTKRPTTGYSTDLLESKRGRFSSPLDQHGRSESWLPIKEIQQPPMNVNLLIPSQSVSSPGDLPPLNPPSFYVPVTNAPFAANEWDVARPSNEINARSSESTRIFEPEINRSDTWIVECNTDRDTSNLMDTQKLFSNRTLGPQLSAPSDAQKIFTDGYRPHAWKSDSAIMGNHVSQPTNFPSAPLAFSPKSSRPPTSKVQKGGGFFSAPAYQNSRSCRPDQGGPMNEEARGRQFSKLPNDYDTRSVHNESIAEQHYYHDINQPLRSIVPQRTQTQMLYVPRPRMTFQQRHVRPPSNINPRAQNGGFYR